MNRSMMWVVGLLAGMMLVLSGCATAPETAQERQNLSRDADATLRDMKSASPRVSEMVSKAYGYAVFPSVGKGGIIVGGAWGQGVVYQGGKLIGYSDLTQANVGLQLGGQTYSELIVFENAESLNKFKLGNYAFAADASAVAIKSGASSSADYRNGVAVFTNPLGGAMFEASVGGQKFSYVSAQTVNDNHAAQGEGHTNP